GAKSGRSPPSPASQAPDARVGSTGLPADPPPLKDPLVMDSIQSALWTNAAPVIGLLGLVLAALFYFRVKGLPDGDETMNRIAGYIREGAMAFLMRQYKVLAIF